MTPSMSTGGIAPRGNISGYKVKNVPNFTPQQMQLFQQAIQSLLSRGGLEGGIENLSQLASGDEEAFGQLEAPTYSAFQGLLGDIGSRFSGVGALGSSSFQNATSGAAKSLAENLGSQRMGIQQNAIDRLLGLSQNLLGQKPYETVLQKKQPKSSAMFGDILSKVLPSVLALL